MSSKTDCCNTQEISDVIFMDLDGSKQVCGICMNWKGNREFIGGLVRVKPSSRGQCEILGKIKPPHGGCDQWNKWNGKEGNF